MTDQASDVGPDSSLELFSHATAVRERTPGLFDADLNSEWTIAGRPNGGYLLSLLGRAASAMADSGHVVASNAHFMRSPRPGPVEIHGELLRRGRAISQVRVRMSQDGRSCVEALMGIGTLHTSATPLWDTGVPGPSYLPFDECVRLAPFTPDGSKVPLFEQIDVRLEGGSMGGITRGRPSGRGHLQGWLKLLGDEDFDPLSLLLAVDAFPPSNFDTEINNMVSTVELTTYIRALPAPGPVRVLCRAGLIDPQFADETCHVWDSTGRLVAQATQLVKVPLG